MTELPIVLRFGALAPARQPFRFPHSSFLLLAGLGDSSWDAVVAQSAQRACRDESNLERRLRRFAAREASRLYR
jgi:hypothetical protein